MTFFGPAFFTTFCEQKGGFLVIVFDLLTSLSSFIAFVCK